MMGVTCDRCEGRGRIQGETTIFGETRKQEVNFCIYDGSEKLGERDFENV
jgi:hypothetical protein